MAQEISYEEWLKLTDEMNRPRGSYGNAGSYGGSSDTITSRQIDQPSSGGGGMSQLSAFTDLGDKLNKNAYTGIQLFSNLANERRDRERQTRMDAEDKRRFGITSGLQTRGRNLEALDYLAGQRGVAGNMASSRLPFRSALASAALR